MPIIKSLTSKIMIIISNRTWECTHLVKIDKPNQSKQSNTKLMNYLFFAKLFVIDNNLLTSVLYFSISLLVHSCCRNYNGNSCVRLGLTFLKCRCKFNSRYLEVNKLTQHFNRRTKQSRRNKHLLSAKSSYRKCPTWLWYLLELTNTPSLRSPFGWSRSHWKSEPFKCFHLFIFFHPLTVGLQKMDQ